MSKKLMLLLTGGLIIGLVIGISAMSFSLDTAQATYEAKNLERRPLTRDEKINVAKMTKKLADAYDDIEQSFRLDRVMEQYVQLGLNEQVLFADGKMKEFPDRNLCQEIVQILDKKHSKLPIGSVKPLILIKKDGTEIIFAYKKGDINFIDITSKQDKEWVSRTDSKQGKPELDFDSIKVDEVDINAVDPTMTTYKIER
jgi:hypothetical protein